MATRLISLIISKIIASVTSRIGPFTMFPRRFIFVVWRPVRLPQTLPQALPQALPLTLPLTLPQYLFQELDTHKPCGYQFYYFLWGPNIS